MKSPKKYFALTVLITLAVFCLPAALVWFADPFQFYHKLWVRKDAGFDATDRYQNAGLINSWLADKSQKIDTIILGSSMSQNFPTAKMQNEYCAAPLKLTMAGATAKELRLIAEKALQTGNVKKVVWQVFVPYIEQDTERMHAQSPLPLFLYDDNTWNDWRYFFNNNVVEESLGLLKGKTKGRMPLDSLYTWENTDRFEQYSAPENIKILRDELKNDFFSLSSKPPAEIEAMTFPNVEENLIPVLKAHPDVRFYLFFPPVSYYGMARKTNEDFWKDMLMRRAVLKSVAGMENVHVYGFDHDKGIGGDIAVYHDREHYRPWVNEHMGEKIMKGQNRITLKDWDAYTSKLVRKVNAYAEGF